MEDDGARPHAISRRARGSPAHALGQCRPLLLPLLVVLGATHSPVLPAGSNVRVPGLRSCRAHAWMRPPPEHWQGVRGALLRLRGGVILNEDPELLRSERERKREQGRLKRSLGARAQQPAQATGRRLVALRSNPAAGAPTSRRSSQGGSVNSGAGELAGLSWADAGSSAPADEDILPQFTDPDDVPLEDELRDALEQARREIRRQDLVCQGEEAQRTSTQCASQALGASFDVQALLAKCKYMEATGTDDQGNPMTEETGRRYAEECKDLLQQVLAKMQRAPLFSKKVTSRLLNPSAFVCPELHHGWRRVFSLPIPHVYHSAACVSVRWRIDSPVLNPTCPRDHRHAQCACAGICMAALSCTEIHAPTRASAPPLPPPPHTHTNIRTHARTRAGPGRNGRRRVGRRAGAGAQRRRLRTVHGLQARKRQGVFGWHGGA